MGCQPVRKKPVGPKTKTQPRIPMDSNVLSGEPSGSARPTVVTDDGMESAETALCGFPGCGMEFKPVRGRSLYEQRLHKNRYDVRKTLYSKNPQWSKEEMSMLARQEAIFFLEGGKFMNKKLFPCFPNRTLDAIKGQRKYASHKNIVKQYVDEIRNNRVTSTPTSPDRQDASNIDIIDAMEGLGPVKTNTYKAFYLMKIVKILTYGLRIESSMSCPYISTQSSQQKESLFLSRQVRRHGLNQSPKESQGVRSTPKLKLLGNTMPPNASKPF